MITQTVQDVIDAALRRNQLNDASLLATNAELIALISRVQQRKFLAAARVNPDFFGQKDTITLTAGDEVLYTDMTYSPAMISHIEVAAQSGSGYAVGDEVAIVVTSDKDAELAPRVIQQYNKLAGIGSDLNGVTSVDVYYSIMPGTMNTGSTPSTIAMLMPDELIDSIVSEVALYLAIKDNRNAEEIQILKREVEESEQILVGTAALLATKTTRYS